MTGIHELTRQVWKIPPEVRVPIHDAVLEVLAGTHDTSERGRLEGDGFTVSWDGHGRLFARWGEGRAGQRIMVEGRSHWRGFFNRLQQVLASETRRRRLRLEVDVTPVVEFELDDDDLGAMAHQLGEQYGHQIRATLTELAGDTRVQDLTRQIRRLLVDSKNFGTLPEPTVNRINQALGLAREVQSILREDG